MDDSNLTLLFSTLVFVLTWLGILYMLLIHFPEQTTAITGQRKVLYEPLNQNESPSRAVQKARAFLRTFSRSKRSVKSRRVSTDPCHPWFNNARYDTSASSSGMEDVTKQSQNGTFQRKRKEVLPQESLPESNGSANERKYASNAQTVSTSSFSSETIEDRPVVHSSNTEEKRKAAQLTQTQQLPEVDAKRILDIENEIVESEKGSGQNASCSARDNTGSDRQGKGGIPHAVLPVERPIEKVTLKTFKDLPGVMQDLPDINDEEKVNLCKPPVTTTPKKTLKEVNKKTLKSKSNRNFWGFKRKTL